MRRHRRAGFAPEMYVFPGGRVDVSDAAPAALARLEGLTPAMAEERLGIRDADPPAVAYYLAALREAFEETGILVGSLQDGAPPPTAAEDPAVERVRDDLMEGRIDFAGALASIECRLAGDALEYFAHWITPRRLPRRFDARFFAARVEGGTEPIVDLREMTHARWITPAEALAEHERGALAMILPTVRTLEKLQPFSEATEALRALAIETVVTILPDD